MKLTNKDKQGVKVIVSVFIAAIMLGGVVLFLYVSRPEIERVTSCPIDRDISRHNVFIVDTTDAFSPYQFEFLVDRITKLVNEGATYDRYSIYTISSEIGGLSRKVFDMCRPSDGSDMGRLAEGPERARILFVKKFRDPIQSVASVFESMATQDTSPLVEALSDLSQLELIDRRASVAEIFLFSDLLQNSAKWSVYKNQSLPRALVCQDTPGTTSISVYMLERPQSEQRQSAELVTEWRNLLGTCLKQDETISFEIVRF